MTIEFTTRAGKALEGIVKLRAVTLDQRQIVPNARVVGGEFGGAFEVLCRVVQVSILKEKETVVIQVLDVFLVRLDCALERFKCALAHSCAFESDAEQIQCYAGFRIKRCGL